jgi:hypothetical protein
MQKEEEKKLKLKLLKNYLKSSMPQEILNDIAILCIEKNMIKHIDVTQLLVTLHLETLIEIILYEFLNIKKINTLKKIKFFILLIN